VKLHGASPWHRHGTSLVASPWHKGRGVFDPHGRGISIGAVESPWDKLATSPKGENRGIARESPPKFMNLKICPKF